jgi:hypothetical protein
MSNVVVIGTGLAGLATARRHVPGGREVTAIGQLQQAERAQAPGRYHHSGYVFTGLNGDPLAPAQAGPRRRDPIRQGSNPKVAKLSFGMAGPDSPSAGPEVREAAPRQRDVEQPARHLVLPG